jgi:IS5 family transposase
MRYPLVQLAALIAWERVRDAVRRAVPRKPRRPGKPIRLMVGLSYLQHTYDLSDEEVCARWVENPYWQYFCGFDYLQHQLPINPSSLTRWRERIGAERMEMLLKATIEAAVRGGKVDPQELWAG